MSLLGDAIDVLEEAVKAVGEGRPGADANQSAELRQRQPASVR
jgi:hypothetical protein